ncbi:hypothetical protein HanXRQr2_Chr03g0133721 [Helianthus annuus]|uniref:Uncharacterized protein n=1 Tax=Helianthus annuus TaxID=4232 RepID=A0A9K3NY70_HELAN|nr:hypothetical protein HanXRQr2_Chr03g0133721 [Helianthus annuus]
MQRWCKRVLWVANTSSKKGNRFRLKVAIFSSISSRISSPISFRWHHTIHHRNIHPSFLPNGTVLQNPTYPTTPTRPRPHILLKLRTTVRRLNRRTHAVLRLPYHLLKASSN